MMRLLVQFPLLFCAFSGAFRSIRPLSRLSSSSSSSTTTTTALRKTYVNYMVKNGPQDAINVEREAFDWDLAKSIAGYAFDVYNPHPMVRGILA